MKTYTLNNQNITYQSGIELPNANGDLIWYSMAEVKTWSDEKLAEHDVVKVPDVEPVLPTQDELIKQATEAVRRALQNAIDIKAQSLGFSEGNALMLYAGFTNPFKTLAVKFAAWEASVWVEAEAYKAQVLAGTKPMVSGEEAVAMMPTYPN